jgi:hypothetical protein
MNDPEPDPPEQDCPEGYGLASSTISGRRLGGFAEGLGLAYLNCTTRNKERQDYCNAPLFPPRTDAALRWWLTAIRGEPPTTVFDESPRGLSASSINLACIRRRYGQPLF